MVRIGCLALMTCAAPLLADNGALGIVRPVHGIVIDGDLSDWPSSVVPMSLPWTAYGRQLDGIDDLQATVRVGIAPDASALLVAIEVVDQSILVDPSPQAGWDTQDGAEIFVRWADSTAVHQIVRYGDLVGGDAIGEVRRSHKGFVYEWRLPAPTPLSIPSVLAFDVAVCDRDADGTFSWQAWGRGEQKRRVSGRMGDLLISGPNEAIHILRGQVVQHDGAHVPAERVSIDLESGHRLTARTDEAGQFLVSLPEGQHQLAAYSGSDTVHVRVPDADRATVTLQDAAPTGEVRTEAPVVRRADAALVRGAWSRWGILDGLPSGAVAELYIDGSESLLLASQAGLVRYDGAHFATQSLSAWQHPGVQSVLRDHTGDLWLGTGWHSRAGVGAVRVRGDELTAFGTDAGMGHGSVLDIHQVRNGDLWFATYGGLTRFDGRRLRTYTVEDGLGDNIVMALAEDEAGVLWAGTGYARSGGTIGGLSRFDGTRFHTLTTDDGLPSNWVSDVHVTDDGIWVATLGGGAALYDGESFTVLNSDHGLPSDRVWDIDTVGGTLILATSQGLAFVDSMSISVPRTVDGFPGSDVFGATVAASGGVWLATGTGDLALYDPWRVRIVDDAEPLPIGRATKIDRGPGGTLWISGSDGVGELLDGHVVPADVPPGPHDVLGDRHGRVWVATAEGVWRRDDSGWRTIGPQGSGAGVTRLYEDAAGRMWLASRRGAMVVDSTDSVRRLTIRDGLPDSRVVSFADDGQGGVLIGTPSGLGIWREHQTPAIAVIDERSIPLVTEAGGQVWMQRADGLLRYDHGRQTTFGMQDGLPHSQVRVATVDHRGTVWFGTVGGVAMYDTAGLRALSPTVDPVASIRSISTVGNQVWFGTEGRGVLRTDGSIVASLTTDDGLAGNTVYDIDVDASGAVWLVTDAGLTRYHPRPGRPLIELVQVTTDRPLGPRARVSLPTSQDYVAFEFVGREVGVALSSMMYRYRVVPEQPEWRTVTQGRVDISGLSRGEHTFEVVAIDRDLGRSEPLRVQIDVHLPYERMAWASLLVGAVLLVLVQARRLLLRDLRLRSINAELTTANDELSSEIQRRERAEADRAMLGLQVDELRYLNELRGALDNPETLDDVLHAVGDNLCRAMDGSPGARIELECDGRRWTRNVGVQTPEFTYEAGLVWGDRKRGRLRVASAQELGEGERRALIDETAAAVARHQETRELTAQLLQSARLVSLGEMAAGVAHELNQPLAAISTVAGDVHLRLLEGRRIEDEQLKEMMSQLTGLVRRMSGTIDHLRVFSRDSSEEPHVLVPLNDVVSASLRMVQAQLANRGIEVVVDLEPDARVVAGHPFQLEQVFLNLLANARDAIDERAESGVTFGRRIDVQTVVADDGWLEATVKDNGIGIDREAGKRLFEPFYTTKDASRGTGLGLSISYAIVRNHGGQLRYESSPSLGTTFLVRLPPHDSEPEP